jgi:hypothetical protein
MICRRSAKDLHGDPADLLRCGVAEYLPADLAEDQDDDLNDHGCQDLRMVFLIIFVILWMRVCVTQIQ